MDASLFNTADSTSERSGWLAYEGAWSGRCRTTRWSVVLAAATEGEQARRALSALYRAYWHPVHAFIARRRGSQVATELTQAFLVQRFVDSGDLKCVQRRSGQRFRGWLFTALQSFLKNQWKFERRQRRDITKTLSWCGTEPGDDSPPPVVLTATGHDPERQLERARALALLSDVLRQLRHEYCAHAETAGVDGAARFEALKPFLPGPNAERADYRACAASLGSNADAVKQAVRRLRLRFADLLNERLGRSVKSDAEIALARRALCEALELPAPPHAGA
jgi:DNA-directed RNA polymerase specialized sigma24 family protein